MGERESSRDARALVRTARRTVPKAIIDSHCPLFAHHQVWQMLPVIPAADNCVTYIPRSGGGTSRCAADPITPHIQRILYSTRSLSVKSYVLDVRSTPCYLSTVNHLGSSSSIIVFRILLSLITFVSTNLEVRILYQF